MEIKYGSVCSGIEAATMAWHPLGMRAAWFAEIEAFPSAVLAHHYPTTPNLGDMTRLAALVLAGKIEAPDVLVGGTPCQAFSVAGMRQGLLDPRGALTIKYVELADAADYVRAGSRKPPCIVVWENVPGVLSDKGNAFGCFLGALAGEDCELQPSGKRWPDAGCVYGPKRTIAWRILDAQYFGLAQRRRRVFVVASARSGFDPLEVLFERDGVRRDTAPRREAGEESTVSPTLRAGGNSTGGDRPPETDVDTADSLQVVAFAIQAGALRTNPDSGPDGMGVQSEHAYTLEARAEVQAVCVTGDITHTLKAEGFDGSEDGTGRGQPIVSVSLRGREGGGAAELGEEISNTLRAAGGGGDKAHALIGQAVRRLTPVECERLQGMPDDYTQIPWRGKPADECPDGPRYKAIGNSKAVTVVRWIGQRLLKQITPSPYG